MTSPNTANTNAVLIKALIKREAEYHAALERLVGLSEIALPAESDVNKEISALREAIELGRILRRVLEYFELSPRDIDRTFGAPGDFGYETAIGDALARVYGVRT